MISREFLNLLRELNAAGGELKRVGLSTPERERYETRIAELRRVLPTALLGQHDQLVREGHASIVAVSGSTCGKCQVRLPVALLAELNEPGRIAVCPHCGVFVFKETGAPARRVRGQVPTAARRRRSP